MDSNKEFSAESAQELERKAQQLLEEKEAESRMRSYLGPMAMVVTVLLVAWSVFQMYYSTIGIINAMHLRAWHCLMLVVFTFLLYPTFRKERKQRRLPPVWDIALIGVAAFAFGYFLMNYDRIARSGGYTEQIDLIVAALGLLVVLEAARRASGNLAVLGLIFFLYNFFGVWIPGRLGHSGFQLKRVLGHMFWGSQGIFGVGIGVSATYIFLFVLFGAFLKHSGFSQFINDISLTLVGRSPGGPAKVAVVASALMGMINGSAVANVATTGTITIPLMKKIGYDKDFAAAVEAVASTGGQFAPPIMGAVGFVMADFMGISYTKVMIAAAIPAFLYYLGLLFAVHFEARRLGLQGLAKENIPDALKVLRTQGYMILPLVVLLWVMFTGRTPLMAAAIAILVTIVQMLVVPLLLGARSGRSAGASLLQGLRSILDATVEGARGAVGVGVSCVVIGVIIGTVSLTSLGLNLGYLVLEIVGDGQIYLGGLMVMVMSIILGMGVPGVAAYVIVAAVAIPVLTDIGVIPMAAHMFCLIYACLSNITPPVAMSSYVAAGIAGSGQTRTSLIAVKLGLTGFLVPFFFLDNPLLLIGVVEGVGTMTTVWAFLTASFGVVAMAAGLQGVLLGRCNPMQRLMLIAVGLLGIDTSLATDLIALGLFAAVLVWQFVGRKRAAAV